MTQNPARTIMLLILALSTITACSPPTLGDINCQAGDVQSSPPFIHLSEDAIITPNLPFPDQMTDYSRVALSENQLTITNVLCTIRVYESADLAATALQLLCRQSEWQPLEANYGQSSCGFQNDGIHEVHFQQGDAVVTIREDSDGAHIGQWAAAVIERLD